MTIPFQTSAQNISSTYQKAKKRLLLLDYDGTLTDIKPTPAQAVPTPALLGLLGKLAGDPHSDVVIVSGRDHHTLEKWFGHVPLDFAAEHGLFARQSGRWRQLHKIDDSWKEAIRPLLETYVQQVPGSFIEEKTLSLGWHYRAVDAHLAALIIPELGRQLAPQAKKFELKVMHGNKVVEIMPHAFDKGSVAQHWLAREQWDFVLAAGDDTTDEDLFKAVPARAYSIKIGPGHTHAKLRLDSPRAMRALLRSFV